MTNHLNQLSWKKENLNINTAQVELLIAQRNEARSNKNFDDADRIRDELDKWESYLKIKVAKQLGKLSK